MDTQTVPDDEKCPLEIFISGRKLKDKDLFSKSDPMVKMFIRTGNNNFVLVGKTEVIKNDLNPNFKTPLKCDLVFEMKQEVRFEVVDSDGSSEDPIGEVQTTLGKLAGAKN